MLQIDIAWMAMGAGLLAVLALSFAGCGKAARWWRSRLPAPEAETMRARIAAAAGSATPPGPKEPAARPQRDRAVSTFVGRVPNADPIA